jgi:hypothetical protein
MGPRDTDPDGLASCAGGLERSHEVLPNISAAASTLASLTKLLLLARRGTT